MLSRFSFNVLSRFYYFLRNKIQLTEARLSTLITKRFKCQDSSGLFYFGIIWQNLKLVALEITTDLTKFLVLIFADAGQGFNLFYDQRDLRVCPYSYTGFMSVQKKFRTFSLAGVSGMIIVAIASSLITNLYFGSKSPSMAASYGWMQEAWSATSSDIATHGNDQAGWTKFNEVSEGVEASSSVQLKLISSNYAKTTPEEFLAAGSLAPASLYATTTEYAVGQVMGGGCARGANTDNAGNFYVTDQCLNQIKKFSPTGELLLTVAVGSRPHGVAIDSDGNIYEADYDLPGVKKFGPDGTYISQWGSLGGGDGQFANAFSIVVDSLNNVYVSGLGDTRIQKFTSTGVYVSQFGAPGTGDGEFTGITALAVDKNDNIYTAEGGVDSSAPHRVQKFDSSGNFMAKFGSFGGQDGQFVGMMFGLGVDDNFNVYVDNSDSIKMFDAVGNFVYKWGSGGAAMGEYNGIAGIGVDNSENVYVLEGWANRIQKTQLLQRGPVYISNVIDLGKKTLSITPTFAPTEVASSSFSVTFLAGNTPTLDETWVVAENVISGMTLSALEGQRYYQYKASHQVYEASSSLPLDSISLDYQRYGTESSSTLISSWYNTEDKDNFLTSLSWKEDAVLPAGVDVKFQVRTSAVEPATSTTAGLIYNWKFDNNWNDTASSSNNLVPVGATFDVPKVGAGSAYFNGLTSYACVPYNPDMEVKDFSLSMWINPAESQVQYADIIDRNHTQQGWVLQGVGGNNFTLHWYYPGAGFLGGETSVALTPNIWQHLAVVKKTYANQTLITYYLNGVQVAQSVSNVPDLGYVPSQDGYFNEICLGTLVSNKGQAERMFSGKLDEFAVYNRALNQDEIVLGLSDGFVGPDGTGNSYYSSSNVGCSKDESGKVSCPINQDINNKIAIGDGADDQFSQYKAYLENDGANTPTIDNIAVGYSLNKKPEFDTSYGFNGVELEEVPGEDGEYTGRLMIRYKVRDRDTALGATAGLITPSFEYLNPWGGNWQPLDSYTLKPADLDNKSVNGATYTLHEANSYLDYYLGGYVGKIKIRVTVNDNEAVNNIASAETETIVDVQQPRSNLQIRQQPKEFLTHEYRVPENATDRMLDNLTGEIATATNVVYSYEMGNTNYRPNFIFNGISSKVELAPIVDFSQGKPFSIYSIVRMNYQAGGCRPIISTGGGDYYFAICADSQDGQNNVVHVVGHGGDFWGTQSISTNNAVQILTVYDGTYIKVYVEGNLEINQPFNHPWGQSDPTYWTLGYGEFNNVYFPGQIGYLATWKKGVAWGEPDYNAFSTSRPFIGANVENSTLNIGIFDENAISYMISNANHGLVDGQNPISGIWQNTGTTSSRTIIPWIFTDGTSRDVYVRAKDAYNNIHEDEISIPYAPTKLDLKDLSNVKDGKYREYISWQVSNLSQLNFSSDFNDYIIYRSTDGTNYSRIGYVDDRLKNYFSDDTAENGKKYYYRVSVMLRNGVESEKSTVVSDKADGQGGTDFTPPTISSTTVASVDSTWARVIWNTDELANSTVEYSTKVADTYASSTLVISMVTEHEAVISGLQPNTDYVFRLKSKDPLNNIGEDNNSGAGYEFKTKAGAVISNVATVHTSNYMAGIVWQTSVPTTGKIIYSEHQGMINPVTVNSVGSSVSHELDINGLIPGETYYYEVHATDGDGNESVNNNNGNYYIINTSNDTEPPIIDGVEAEPKTSFETMIDWHTNEPANSTVHYGVAAGVYTGSASSTDLVSSHVVEIYGLNPEQKYYYVVISADGSGNRSTSTEHSFTSIEPLITETVVKEREKVAVDKALAKTSSGIMVINKTDTTAPSLSQFVISKITDVGAYFSWLSDELTDTFVEFGMTDKFGKAFGKYDSTKDHAVVLDSLNPGTTYYVRATGKDANGNLAKSDVKTFKTLGKEQAEKQSIEKILTGNDGGAETLNPQTAEEKSKLVSQAMSRALDILSRFSGDISLGSLESTLGNQSDVMEKLSMLVPSPNLSAEPSVEVSATEATIHWETNKDATSFVSYGPEAIYNLHKDRKGYSQIVGSPDILTKTHNISLTGLKPQTTYHYQVRSKAKIGTEAFSGDFTFRTKEELLEINHFYTERSSGSKASVKWVTSMPADTRLTYTPFRGGKLAIDEQKVVNDKSITLVHEVKIEDFESGVIYQIEMASTDTKGKNVSKVIPAFSTTRDDLPPEVTNIQTESALSSGKNVKVQTIITWTTSEPTICHLKYAKGVFENEDALTELTPIETSYSRKHTAVVTKFDLGQIYTFRVVATDSGGNSAVSGAHTLLTPMQSQSVFDLIMNTMESTFGWLGKVR